MRTAATPLDRFEGPFDLELGDAPEPAQALFVGVAVAGAGEAQFEDRVQGRIETQDERALGLAGQEHQIQLLQRFLGGLGHVGAPHEFEGHVAQAAAADAGQAASVRRAPRGPPRWAG
jgi:hypothetical protein